MKGALPVILAIAAVPVLLAVAYLIGRLVARMFTGNDRHPGGRDPDRTHIDWWIGGPGGSP
jgi:hypothetical protein